MIHSTQIHAAAHNEQEYLAGWQRARAELDNLRKRYQNAQAQQRQQIKREVIESLLALADSFQSLQRHVPDTLAQDSWVTGVKHVARQFEQLLVQQGVQTINPAGDPFDPAQHEAVDQISPNDEPSGIITKVIQPGYKIDNLVIRPAKVRVSI